MILDANTKTKISSLTNVEDVVLFCGILLQETYQNLRRVEGLDATNAEVSVNAITVDYLPVTRASGSKEYRAVVRASFDLQPAFQYKAAKWSYITPFGSETPLGAIVNTANLT